MFFVCLFVCLLALICRNFYMFLLHTFAPDQVCYHLVTIHFCNLQEFSVSKEEDLKLVCAFRERNKLSPPE